MSKIFARSGDLPGSGCTRQHLYNLVEQVVPLLALVDGSDASTDQTLTVESGLVAANMCVPRWRKFTIPYNHVDLNVATSNPIVDLFEMGTYGFIHAVRIKASAQFAGVTAATVAIGKPTNPTLYTNTYDLTAAVSESNQVVTPNAGELQVPGQAVQAHFDVAPTGDALSAGSVDVWVLYSECA